MQVLLARVGQWLVSIFITWGYAKLKTLWDQYQKAREQEKKELAHDADLDHAFSKIKEANTNEEKEAAFAEYQRLRSIGRK